MLNLTPAVQEAVQKAIAEAEIPEGKRGALILVADGSGAHAIVATRLDTHWTIRAGVTHEWSGENAAAAEVRAVW